MTLGPPPIQSSASPLRYVPAGWLPGPHSMTVFAHLARKPIRLSPRRERWELPDGDFLDVDRHGEPVEPTVVILHGLEGSSHAPYVKRMVASARARGLAALAVNFRGCSGQPNRLRRLYHSGDSGDLAFVVNRLVREAPGRPLAVVGFSLGGSIAAKWMGEEGEALPAEVRAGAVISVPFDLAQCAATFDSARGMGFVYRERFLMSLRRKVRQKLRSFPDMPFDAATVAGCRSFATFDDRITAPLNGFASAQDYWDRASATRSLARVDRPLLAIASVDDPIVPATSLPVEAARENPNVSLEIYPAGGHVAFVSGHPWRFGFFAQERVAQFLSGPLGR